MNKSGFKLAARAIILLIAALLLVCDALTLTTWREQTVPQANGQLGGAFAPGIVDERLRLVRVDADGALARAGAKVGDLIVFAHQGTPLRLTFALTESVPATLYNDSGAQRIALRPLPTDGSGSVLSGALYLLNDLVALALVVAIVVRRGSEGAMLAFALAMLANSPVTFMPLLPAGALQDAAALIVRPLDFVGGYVFFLLFALKFPNEQAKFRQRWVPPAFYCLSAVFLITAVLSMSAKIGALHVPPGLLQVLGSVAKCCAIGTAILSLAVLFHSWRVSASATRSRLAWILLSIGTMYLFWAGINFLEVMDWSRSEAATEFAINVVSALSSLGFAYALLRHQIFDFGFAVNRTLVFTMTSLVLFLAFWLIEQVVHKLIHFDAADKNAMLGGAIAFGLFFTFNRVHHRVDHWIEHLFFKTWRARESALRKFVAKAAHFMEIDTLLAAFGTALDRFTGNTGNAIYLAGDDGAYRLAHGTIPSAPALLPIDDDIAVTLRATRQVMLPSSNGGSAFPMWHGDELKGIVILATPGAAHEYRPDQLTMLAFAIARICLEISRLQGKAMAKKLQQLLQELDSVKRERATLQLVLSKVPAAS